MQRKLALTGFAHTSSYILYTTQKCTDGSFFHSNTEATAGERAVYAAEFPCQKIQAVLVCNFCKRYIFALHLTRIISWGESTDI